jgi:hypothetical protein
LEVAQEDLVVVLQDKMLLQEEVAAVVLKVELVVAE